MDQNELNAALAASPSPDRITPEYLKSRISSVHYIGPGTLSDGVSGTLTFCVVTLDNGFQVTGESACADPANYNEGIGRKIAYDMAERKIWPLLGFMLKEIMAARSMAPNELEFAARLAHEANRGYCLSIGDTSQAAWEDTPEHTQASVRDGVKFIADNPDAGPDAAHLNWLRFKEAEGGWRYGPLKDLQAKTHPCFLPYDELPPEQRSKDYIFRGVVRAVLGL